MNKQNDNKLALSVVATLTAGIALIYILISYPKLIFAVFGVSVVFLVCAYILTQNIVAFVNMKNKSLNVQIQNGMDDLSSQIEGMSSAQAQLGKATYLYTRQAAENVATLSGNYTDSQEALHKNLSVLANAQNKSTKLLIKYGQNNTNKLISTMKDIKNNINETVSHGFEQIPQTNNNDIVAMLQSIVDYLKSQPTGMDQSLGMQINNVAHELQNISMNISKVQPVPMQPMMPMQQMNMQPVYQTPPVVQAPVVETPIAQAPIAGTPATETPITETPVVETPTAMDISTEMDAMSDMSIPTNMENSSDVQSIETATLPTDEQFPEATGAETVEAVPETVNETAAVTDKSVLSDNEEVSEDINEDLTIDDIDALLNETAEFTPTFTVVGKSDDENLASESDTEPDIASETMTATVPVTTPETVQVAPVSDDPNKQLSADDIAALFAAAEPAPKKEEPAPAPEPVAVTPVSDDPNKQLSADEIAALFASIG